MKPTVSPSTDTAVEATPPGMELAALAEFIKRHARSSLDVTIATTLSECADVHAHWAQDCTVQHWNDDFPCDDYERSLHLGIAWLKARIEDAS